MKLIPQKSNSNKRIVKNNWIINIIHNFSKNLKLIWRSWLFQVAVIIFAFLLGAIVYRSGIFRPFTNYIRGFFNSAPLIMKIPQLAQDAINNIDDEIRLYINNGLPTMYIDMAFEDYQKLLKKRNEALEIGILTTTDADFVDGEIHLQNGPTLEAKLRLKGDWTDHLAGDKWSFRIEIKNGEQILGMKQMSIQTPASRNFLNEWAFHQNLIQENVLTTRYNFINVLLNGKLLGIYAIEDHFTAELIESQERRQGLIIRFNEDAMWSNMSAFWKQDLVQGSNLSVTNAWTASIDAFQDSKISNDPILNSEAETAKNLLKSFQEGQLAASEVFDVRLWGRFYALHDLWSAPHGTAWHNLRFYYNPITALLEPVAFDAEPFFRRYTLTTISETFIETKIFNDPLIRTAYAEELFRITSPEYISTLIENLSPEHDRLRDALNFEFPLDVPIPEKSIVVDWDVLKQRAQSLRLELQPEKIIYGSYQAINVLKGSIGTPSLVLDLVNLMMVPVEVIRVDVDHQVVFNTDQIAVLPPVINPQDQGVQSIHLEFPLEENIEINWDSSPEVTTVVRIKGLEQEYEVDLDGTKMPESLQIGPIPKQPTIQQVMQQHPFLQSDPEGFNTILVSPGIWDVEGDLIIPDQFNFIVPAGTIMRFGEGKILYSNGSINLLGTSDSPVVLTARNGNWGGIVVLNAIKSSTWQYAVIDKTSGIARDGWQLTGGITFFKSQIFLDNTVLGNNLSEDALNIIQSTFNFQNCEFQNTFSDAFDSDFSSGEINNCYFHDINGDAIDFSGSTVKINNTKMERINDKGVSAGEKSQINISELVLDNVSIGIASKDLSSVYASNIEIRNASFAALAAYIKKPVFGPGMIDVRSVKFENTKSTAIVQTGSSIFINGIAMTSADLDVEALYNDGILGN